MTKKYILFLEKCATELPLAADRICCNDVCFPWDGFGASQTHLYCVGNEYGPLGAVWADGEQDALDELIDSGLGEALLLDEATQTERTEGDEENFARLGNAGEACDLDNVWLSKVFFDKARDFELIMALAEARGALAHTLDNI